MLNSEELEHEPAEAAGLDETPGIKQEEEFDGEDDYNKKHYRRKQLKDIFDSPGDYSGEKDIFHIEYLKSIKFIKEGDRDIGESDEELDEEYDELIKKGK